MNEENYLRNYPTEVTCSSVIHNRNTDGITLITTREDLSKRRSTRIFRQKLDKWIMEDIRSSSPKRPLELSDEEHKLFVEALQTEEGKTAIKELKTTKVNSKANEAIDFLSEKVIKSTRLKEIWALLKTEDLTGHEEDSVRSLSITSRDMYNFLVEKGIIKVNQPINA